MNIFVTPRAYQEFEKIILFLETKFGKPTTSAFVKKSDNFFSLLKLHPLLGKEETQEIRGFQLTKQIRVLYRIKSEKIIIISFFDVRQDPKKKPS